jgi:hypothetical protein
MAPKPQPCLLGLGLRLGLHILRQLLQGHLQLLRRTHQGRQAMSGVSWGVEDGHRLNVLMNSV